ncbi:MAG: rod shape-determining protein [Anaerolineaceae bacterium]|nr:rod shape-determining protein [Anaerolineae bacterium]MDX9829942.1 rod shape-determining protein [Anaerolineae bacterium]NLF15056.1 rod shape-determining protein [Anaerolineaceae bacterium]
MLTKHIGVDLGTVNVLVWVRGKGIILQEPSVVAIATNDNKIVAVGNEARAMLGRTPETIEVARPLRDGVIADYVVTEAMLRYFIEKVAGRLRLLKPIISISVPVGVTSVESRAVHDAAIQAGGREAYLIPEPLAAALGAGMPVNTPTGNLVVDIGGGTSEAAVIAMNGIVEYASVRVGGNRIDEAIMSYVKRKYNLMIGEQTAEEVKIAIGSALPLPEELTMEVRGRDQVSGLPKTIRVTSGEITEAIAEPLVTIVGVVRNVLEKTPPELASDVIDRGIVMTGGGALLRGFHQLLTKETGVPCYVADNPIACVALGAGKALENYEVIRRSLPAY